MSVDVRFQLFRDGLRAMHSAVDRIELPVVFPRVSNEPTALLLGQTNMYDAQQDLTSSALNESQQQVVRSILQDDNRQVSVFEPL